MKQFTSVHDVSDIDALVQTALHYKSEPLKDIHLGKHKRIGLIFLNPSLRTRISTQIAAKNLGMDSIVFNIDKEGWNLELEEDVVMNGSSVEHIKDAAPILGQYFDILCVRTFPALYNRQEDYSEQLLMQLITHTGIPVISLESTTLHPLQSLADVVTIQEHRSAIKKPKVVLTWAPHIKPLPQCVPNSFAQWLTAWGETDLVIAHPEGYNLKADYTKGAYITHNQKEALEGADFVYVKNWSSYEDYGKILCTDPAWMIAPNHMTITNNAKLMHCLPVRRNVELSSDVLDSNNSIVTQQAANRVWAAQAVLSTIIKAM
jgi:N-succinyl-L-ornithine transcarbamylase